MPDANEFLIMPTKEWGDLNNSDEFQDVECDNSDDSFVSSLEQFVGNDDSIRKSFSIENCPSPDDGVSLEKSDSNGFVLIEEILEEVVEKSLADNWNAHVDGLENGKSEVYLEKEVENCRATEQDLKGNSMKITFYCESVNKLMSDPAGDECDELIQEITPTTVDNQTIPFIV